MANYVITLKNESSSSLDSIMIFQENENEPRDIATAWNVFNPFDKGMSHHFEFSNDFEIVYKDIWGNFTARRKVEFGKQYAMVDSPEGCKIVEKESFIDNLDCFEMLNELSSSNVDCLVYRSGLLFAEAKGVAPNKKAAFGFKPKIFIGTASGLKNGDTINTNDAQIKYTSFNMEGVKAAKIIYKEESLTTKPSEGSFKIDILERYD